MELNNTKFKAFDTVSKKLSPSFSLFGEFTMTGLVFGWVAKSRKASDLDIGISCLNDLRIIQYTGLKDQNENEIYEKDFLEVYDPDNQAWFKNKVQVVFKNGCFVGRWISPNLENRENVVLGEMEKHLKVIGNIYKKVK